MFQGTRYVALCAAAFIAGCGGSTSNTQPSSSERPSEESGSKLEAPAWFHSPPKSPSHLYFVGNVAGQPDEATARDMAVQKALAELTVYCGAQVSSDFKSEEREANGDYQQVISMNVDIAGDDVTVREAVVQKTVVGKGAGGGFEAYALVQWPKAQYDAVLGAQKERASRALELYLAAEDAERQKDVINAKTKLKEAKATLGPQKTNIPLSHAKISNSALLWDAIDALDQRLSAAEKEKKNVFAVAVACEEGGKAKSCKSHRVGAVRETVSGSGYKLSADNLTDRAVSQILASDNPQLDASIRSSGKIIAVRYAAELLGTDGPFTFINCGARGVVFDTATARIVSTQEVAPKKGGHPSFDGAVEKACGEAEKDVLSWLKRELPSYK